MKINNNHNSSIEDTILSKDQRNISAVRQYLPDNYCSEAAMFLERNLGTILIVTGFTIKSFMRGETDGPIGAVALGQTVKLMGGEPIYISDGHNCDILKTLTNNENTIIDFPITDHHDSESFAQKLLEDLNPSLLVSIERVGFNKTRSYFNRFGESIDSISAKADYLFMHHQSTIGIGDGGNEIGMGLIPLTFLEEMLPINPSITPTSSLIIAGTSNWGSYGLITALSVRQGINLLPSSAQENQWLRQIVENNGAVDSFTSGSTQTVDGYKPKELNIILNKLHNIVNDSLSSNSEI